MKKQRSIVLFLVKFFAAYFILFTVYSLYLHHTQKKDELYSCSPITTLVDWEICRASHSKMLSV